MRLLHIGQQTSKIADDIRAALTALGRGESVTGGIALIGVAAPEFAEPIDAVLLLPHAVVLVLGVDLPGPAVHLEAPLRGEWKSDGWGLSATGNGANPGSKALSAAEAFARRLHGSGALPVPIRAILAVGPYAGAVTTADAGDDGSVLVLHPTPSAVRDALGSFPEAQGATRCTVEQVRAILRAIDPALPIQPDTTLAKEGFLAGTASARSTPASADPAAGDFRSRGLGAEATPRNSETGAKDATRPALLRWVIVAAVVLVLTLAVLALVVPLG